MTNKEAPLPCIICGQIDCFRLVFYNKLIDLPPYVICLKCIDKAKNKEIKNEN